MEIKRGDEKTRRRRHFVKIISFEKAHWVAVRKIYQDGIDTGIATFEDLPPDWDTWDRKFINKCRLAAIDSNSVV